MSCFASFSFIYRVCRFLAGRISVVLILLMCFDFDLSSRLFIKCNAFICFGCRPISERSELALKCVPVITIFLFFLASYDESSSLISHQEKRECRTQQVNKLKSGKALQVMRGGRVGALSARVRKPLLASNLNVIYID